MYFISRRRIKGRPKFNVRISISSRPSSSPRRPEPPHFIEHGDV
jgi:hypothetical protein